MFEPPRGMDDLLPDEMRVKRRIEETIREVFRLYGYDEIETPTLEYRSLFEAKSGDEIRHRMFTLQDMHGRVLALRPEVTASVARVVATRMKSAPTPIRLGYIADCYRYDEPQWGRRRRFWHGGFEIFGSTDPLSDAEIMIASNEVFKRLGLTNIRFKTGHVGIMRGILSEQGVDERIQDSFLNMLDRKMVDEAFSLLSEHCHDATVIGAIRMLSQLSGDEKIFSSARDVVASWPTAAKALENFEEIIGIARDLIKDESRITIDFGFARGLEYYTGFIFEQYVDGLDIAFNGGGRYDKLVEIFGGKHTPGVGCAIGITRIQTYLMQKAVGSIQQSARIFVSVLSDKVRSYAFKVAQIVRSRGMAAELDVTRKRLSAAFEYCEKKRIKYMLVVGEKEAAEDKAALRNLETREQIEVPLSQLGEFVENLLRSGLS
ncbi:MAG: histidine--tRNA ligase [Aigarchaeota archaeon]|nr:histidine--tRNA ligase [Candidatus Pelearchaeum maunauluense]